MSCLTVACLAAQLVAAEPPPSQPTAAPPPPPVEKPYTVRAKVRKHRFNFIIDAGGGGRLTQGGDFGGAGYGRLTLGAAHLLGRMFFAEGVFYEISNVSYATLGIHYMLMFPSRFFIDGGPSVDIEARLGGHAGLGWGIFGVEVQYRQGPDRLPTALILARICVIQFILRHNAKPPKKGGDV